MGTIADERDRQFDERIILLFPDEMWEELSQTISSDNNAPGEALLELLSRQVWAFLEGSKIYLTTRSVVICCEVVALSRGDYGLEVNEISETTQTIVTQAFRFGVKIEADWELVTTKRGLPFPTTKGALKLLDAVVLDGTERPRVKSAAPFWNQEESPEQKEPAVSAQVTQAPPVNDEVKIEQTIEQPVLETAPVSEPVSIAPEVSSVVQNSTLESTDENKQGAIDSWISNIMKKDDGAPDVNQGLTIQSKAEKEEQENNEVAASFNASDTKEDNPQSAVDSWISMLLHASEIQEPSTPVMTEIEEPEIQAETEMVSTEEEDEPSFTQELKQVSVVVEEASIQLEPAIIDSEDIELETNVEIEINEEPPVQIEEETISLSIEAEQTEVIADVSETLQNNEIKAQKGVDVDSFIQEILQAKSEKLEAATKPALEPTAEPVVEEISPVNSRIEEAEPAAAYSADSSTDTNGKEKSSANKNSVDSWIDMILKSKPKKEATPSTVSEATFVDTASSAESAPEQLVEEIVADSGLENIEVEIKVEAESKVEIGAEVEVEDDTVDFWSFGAPKKETDTEESIIVINGQDTEASIDEKTAILETQTEIRATSTPVDPNDKQSSIDAWIKQARGESSQVADVTQEIETVEVEATNENEPSLAESINQKETVFESSETVQEEEDVEFEIISDIDGELVSGISDGISFQEDSFAGTNIFNQRPEEVNVVASVFGQTSLLFGKMPAQAKTNQLLEILAPAGPAIAKQLNNWAQSPKWCNLPESALVRIACVLPTRALVREYWESAAANTNFRCSLVENGGISEQKDGAMDGKLKNLWTARYRQARLSWESESTRLRMLRSQMSVIEKYCKEYLDFQEELERLEWQAQQQTAQSPVEESPAVLRIRQELMVNVAKQKSIEQKLTKLVNSSKGMRNLLNPKYLNLQEEYRLLLQQASLKSQELAQYTGGASENSSHGSHGTKVYDQQYEQKRSQLLQEISAIDRFINESYGKQFKADPAWSFFERKDYDGLRNTLDERVKFHQAQEKALSQWQRFLESDISNLLPQVWVLAQDDINFIESAECNPHIFVLYANVTLATSDLSEKVWTIASQNEEGDWAIEAGELNPPIEPQLFWSVFGGDEQCIELARIVWEERELSSLRED